MGWLARHEQTLLSILRIVAGLLFLEHGTQKILGFPAPLPAEMLAGVPPAIMTLLMVAGTIELVGGTLIAIGLFTRLAAFICSGEMAAAYFLGHMSRGGFWPILNQGGEAILFCFIFLFLAAAGPGPIAVSRSTKL
jgi:putative oxidoreductase